MQAVIVGATGLIGKAIADLLSDKGHQWEKVEAWGADWKFGREYHQKISKMAIVGNKTWEK
jgi:aspartate-semialdehyde dehydrogenase